MTTANNLVRCEWASIDPLMQEYHDLEWGKPIRDSRKLFELLNLEGAQAGLSWLTILKRRPGYYETFFNYSPEEIATFDEAHLAIILQNPGIIRNRLKVNAVIQNAKAYLAMKENSEDFSEYLWSYADGLPLKHKDAAKAIKISEVISKDLKKRGFTFVGPTIVFAYMQSAGLINDHVNRCYLAA